MEWQSSMENEAKPGKHACTVMCISPPHSTQTSGNTEKQMAKQIPRRECIENSAKGLRDEKPGTIMTKEGSR